MLSEPLFLSEFEAFRFWARVRPMESGCWHFDSKQDSQTGHRKAYLRKGMRFWAHRLSYALNVGVIPDGMVVMHLCDNPQCVNPSHLRIGTQRDNLTDAWSKGAMRPSESLRRNGNGFFGVRYDSRGGKRKCYRAHASFNGHEYSGGMHYTAEDAARKHDELLVEHYGGSVPVVLLNFPPITAVA